MNTMIDAPRVEPIPGIWVFPMPSGDRLILSKDATGFFLQEELRDGSLAIGQFPDLTTALAAAVVWLASGGVDPSIFRPDRDPATRRVMFRHGLRPETAEVVAALAYGGRDNG